MEPRRQAPARMLLKVGSVLFLTICLLVTAVAFITSGVPVVGGPTAWYAVLVPPLYGLACALWAFGAELPRPVVWTLHLVALPALVYSLLGLGLLLPFLAALWWVAAGKPALLGRSASPA